VSKAKSRLWRTAQFDAGPAPWIKPLPPTGAWAGIGSQMSDAEWKVKHSPLVVFDSGWYEHRPGDPLPPIESFRIAPSAGAEAFEEGGG